MVSNQPADALAVLSLSHTADVQADLSPICSSAVFEENVEVLS